MIIRSDDSVPRLVSTRFSRSIAEHSEPTLAIPPYYTPKYGPLPPPQPLDDYGDDVEFAGILLNEKPIPKKKNKKLPIIIIVIIILIILLLIGVGIGVLIWFLLTGKKGLNGKCTSNSNCKTGLVCSMNQNSQSVCKSNIGSTCTSSTDCLSGGTCDNGSCKLPLKSSCTSSTEPVSACASGLTCNNGMCLTSPGGACSTDSDCMENYGCENNTCKANVGTSCSSNSDCLLPFSCLSGTCSATPCTVNTDCPSGAICGGTSCISPYNSHCSFNTQCDGNDSSGAFRCSDNGTCLLSGGQLCIVNNPFASCASGNCDDSLVPPVNDNLGICHCRDSSDCTPGTPNCVSGICQ